MEKFLSSGGDKSSKNHSSKIINNSKEKNKKSKSKPKPDNIIGNKIFFNTKTNSNNKNIDNNSLYELQDKLFIPKIIYSNMLCEKNKYKNIRLNSHGEKNYNNHNNNQEEDSIISKYKEKLNNKELKILELKEELKKLEKNYNDNNKNLMRKYQNNNKSNNRNMFLFYNSSRNGNIINANNKNKIKENKIMYKTNNIYNINRKSYEKKKAKSTQKIGGYIHDIKNNYFFMMSNKKNQKNTKYFGLERGKTMDYKNNKNNINNNQILLNSININQTNNVKKININIDSNISQEIVNYNNLTHHNKDKYNNTKKNWTNYPKTEPVDKINKNNNNNIEINDFGKIANNFIGNIEEFENINTNNSFKNNININKQNIINCYSNYNFNNNNLNIYINNNSSKVSNKNSNNNSNSKNMINALMKSKNCNTPTRPNSNYFENKIYKYEKDINIDSKNKYEILSNNIQYLFNQYFQYFNCKNNSNKK